MEEEKVAKSERLDKNRVLIISVLAILAMGIIIAIIFALAKSYHANDDGSGKESNVASEAEYPKVEMDEIKDVDDAEDVAEKADEYIEKHLEIINKDNTSSEDKLRSIERIIWLCSRSGDCYVDMSIISKVGDETDFSEQQRNRYYFAVDTIYGFNGDANGRIANLRNYISFLEGTGGDDATITYYRGLYEKLLKEVGDV